MQLCPAWCNPQGAIPHDALICSWRAVICDRLKEVFFAIPFHLSLAIKTTAAAATTTTTTTTTTIMRGKVTSPNATAPKGKSHINRKKSHQEHPNPMARRDSTTYPISSKSRRSIAHIEIFEYLDDNINTHAIGTALSTLHLFSSSHHQSQCPSI